MLTNHINQKSTEFFNQSVYSDLYQTTIDFEKNWYSNNLSIEDALAKVDSKDAPNLFERLLDIDIALKSKNNLPINEDEYKKRFPQWNDIISAKFNSLRDGSLIQNSVIVKRRLGTQIGNYQFVNVIGQGGMGIVYEGFDNSPLQRKVAIKSIITDPKTQQERLTLFEKELTILGKLPAGSAFVQAYGSEKDQEYIYLIMEYIDGINIKKYVENHVAFKRTRLSSLEAMRLTREITEGLKTIHRLGIVHRDIKPDNIMLEKSGRIRILDLGLGIIAKDSSSHNKSHSLQDVPQLDSNSALDCSQGKIVGTPAYMAPETYWNGNYDTRSDLYSLGGTFFFLLTGKHLNQWFDLTHFVNKEPPSLKEFLNENKIYIPSDTLAILQKLLQSAPKLRYQTAEEVCRDLDAAIARKTPVIYPKRRIMTLIFIFLVVLSLYVYMDFLFSKKLQITKNSKASVEAAQIYYQKGDYQLALDILSKIDEDIIRTKTQKCNYYLLKGKSNLELVRDDLCCADRLFFGNSAPILFPLSGDVREKLNDAKNAFTKLKVDDDLTASLSPEQDSELRYHLAETFLFLSHLEEGASLNDRQNNYKNYIGEADSVICDFLKQHWPLNHHFDLLYIDREETLDFVTVDPSWLILTARLLIVKGIYWSRFFKESSEREETYDYAQNQDYCDKFEKDLKAFDEILYTKSIKILDKTIRLIDNNLIENKQKFIQAYY